MGLRPAVVPVELPGSENRITVMMTDTVTGAVMDKVTIAAT